MVPHFESTVDPKVMNKILPGASYEEFIEYMDWDAVVNYYRGFIEEEVLSESRRIVRDEWGVVKRYTQEVDPMTIESPIKSEEDLETYQPPDPDVEHCL